MRKSIVYFFVLLTMLSLSLTLVPGAFSQTENVKVLNYSWYIDSIGYLVVVGEVQNVGSSTVASVILTGTVYSSDGTQVDSSRQAFVRNLIPQQKAPFYMEFFSQSSADGTWTQDVSNVAITVYQAQATANYQYPDLKITSSSKTITEGVYWVSGTIQNVGSQTAENITVVGTFYNAAGTTVAVGYTNRLAPASLSPSGTATFKVGAFDLNQTVVPSDIKISSYSLLIQTEGPILTGTAPVITPYPSSITSPSASPIGSPSATQSPDSNPTSSLAIESIYAIVIVIVILGIAGTILMLRKRKPQATKKARHG